MKYKLLWSICIIACVISNAAAQQPMLTGIAIRSGKRGLALALSADNPVTAAVSSSVKNNNTVVRLKLHNAVYGLEEFSFTDLPKKSPVIRIDATSHDGTIMLELLIKKHLSEPVKTKSSGNRFLCLLSSENFEAFAWDVVQNSSENVAGGKPPIPQTVPSAHSSVEKKAAIKSLKLVHRDIVEQFIIETDGPVVIETEKRDNALVAVFKNAKSDLLKSVYSLPEKALFEHVSIEEYRHDTMQEVGVVLQAGALSPHSLFVILESARLIIYALRHDLSRFALWSSDKQVLHMHAFSTSAPESKQTQPRFSPANTAPPPSQPSSSIRLIVIRNNVNIRSEPTTESKTNIIKKALMGNKATAHKKQDGWYWVLFDDSTKGWIYHTLVAESSQVTSQQWNKIAETQKTIHSAEKPDTAIALYPPQAEFRNESIVEKSSDMQPIRKSSEQQHSRDTSNKTHITKDKMVTYTNYGRDPYLPLNQCEFLRTQRLDVEKSVLVGILYDEQDRVALLEDTDKANEPLALRENSRVKNGRVLKIKRDKVVFVINDADLSRLFTLKLNYREE